jgi:signal peptidase II
VPYYRRLFFILVPALVILDQITKAWIRVGLPMDDRGRAPRIKVIEGFFNIVHAKNPGAAWGLLGTNDYRMIFFTVVTLVAFVLILGYYRQLTAGDRVLAVGLCSVFAGAAGNFIDRLLFREVTDFLQFYASGSLGVTIKDVFGSRYWPAFNVADICINVGVGLFIVHVLFIEPKRDKERKAAEAAEAIGAA